MFRPGRLCCSIAHNVHVNTRAHAGDDAGLPHHSDRSLSRFLRAKKDVARAADQVQKFDAFVQERGFASLAYADVAGTHEQQIVLVDPAWKNKSGQTLIWLRPARRKAETDAVAVEKIFFYTLNWLSLTCEEVQITGVALLGDLTGFQFKQFDPSIPRTILPLVQKIMPVRLKAIYMVNQPSFFSMIFSVIRVFMGEKVRSRLKILGDPKNLLPFIDLECIPASLGGTHAGAGGDAFFEHCRQLLCVGPDDSANPLPG